MRIVVTGGAGFIGSHVVEKVLERGWEPIVVDDLSAGTVQHLPQGVVLLQADVRDIDQWVPAVGSADAVIHLAAQINVAVSEKEPMRDTAINVLGTVAALEAARQLGARAFRLASSAAVYGDNPRLPLREEEMPAPFSHYGLNKWIAEQYVDYYRRVHQVPATILRLANVYGPRQRTQGEGGVVAIFTEALVRGQPIQIDGDGQQTRDFVFVGDVAEAFLHRLGEAEGDVYNVATAREVTINQLWERLRQFRNAPVPAPRYGAPRVGDIRFSRLATEKAGAWGFWAQTPLEDGLFRTWQDFQHRT